MNSSRELRPDVGRVGKVDHEILQIFLKLFSDLKNSHVLFNLIFKKEGSPRGLKYFFENFFFGHHFGISVKFSQNLRGI